MAKEWAKWFYNSDAWKSTRKAVLLACGYTCELCGGHAEEVHHEIELTPENIRNPAVTLNPQLLHPLCGSCHKLVTKRQKQKRKADCDSGYCFDADGNLTPPGGCSFTPGPEDRTHPLGKTHRGSRVRGWGSRAVYIARG